MAGWQPIIDTLTEYLDEKYAKNRVKTENNTWNDVHNHSWKEKWGELVIDFRVGFDETDHAVADFCESLSTRVCEDCGRPGESRDLPWIRTLCNECFRAKKGNLAKNESVN